jgi:hypothetical protein
MAHHLTNLFLHVPGHTRIGNIAAIKAEVKSRGLNNEPLDQENKRTDVRGNRPKKTHRDHHKAESVPPTKNT